MKTNKLFIIIFSLSLLAASTSCKKELERININPNAVENPQPSYLLTSAIKTTSDAYWVVGGSNPGNLLIQYWAAIQYTDQDRYIFTNASFQGLWTTIYSGSIVNLNKIIELADEENNPNYKGVALVLRSWNYLLLTDVFGDVPYSQAIQIAENVTPTYDAQEDVYNGILNDLKTAAASLDAAGPAIEGDIIYQGDITKWKRLTNSLRLRVALRLSDAAPETTQSVINELKTEGWSFIESNDDIAQVVYLSAPNDNPLYQLFLTRDDYRISKTIVDRLTQLNDPRLPVFVSPTQDPSAPTYVGVPNGLLVGDAGLLGLTRTSKPGPAFIAANSPAVIVSYAEVLFDRAEAAARGLTNEDPEQLYQAAITASLQQYRIDQNSINAYLGQASVKYNPANYKESIGNQKWIALFGQGLEAFAEWRRLDYPELQPAVAGVLNGQIPLRFIYPGTEQSLNGESYRAAVTHQGPDVLTTRLWFDKQ